MKIALVSLNQFWEDKSANKKLCITQLDFCKSYNLDLVIFPEMTLTGFSMNVKYLAEDIENSETINWFSKQAVYYNVNLIFGVVLKLKNRAKNYLVFVSNNGNILTHYSKIHPFTHSKENQFYDGGNNIKNIEFLNTNLGFSICYDLRFPEIFQALSKKSEIIINIANWPLKRIIHWNVLLKARAIENQVFMIGVNRIGIDGNNVEYEKSSMMFDPNGDNVESIFTNESIDVFEIDSFLVRKIRGDFPVKNDRKIKLYKKFYE